MPFVRAALVFYAAMALVAVVISEVRDVPLFPDVDNLRLTILGVIAGLSFGGVVALATRLAAGRTPLVDDLYGHFAELLGPIGWLEAFILALASALGEELLFRGALQPAWGLWTTSLVFAAAHLPPRLELVSWTVFAWLMGLALGWSVDATGGLYGAIGAHFVVNFFNLELAGRIARARSER
ncbi:MAG: CPBP family intramembrane metalloprotease [Deltaproteobacteria bacterium]|nr:CPBP family intramembrane metalloprotease [Deltaproteobacteria bacterium]